MVHSSFSSRPRLCRMAAPLSCSAPVLPAPYHPCGRALIPSVQRQPGYHKLTSIISSHSALRFHTNVHEGLSHIHLHSLLAWGNGVQQDIKSEEAAEPAAPAAIHTLDRPAAASPLPFPSAALGYAWPCWTNSISCMWKSHTPPPSPSF